MAIWLAVDQLDFNGAITVAGGWLRRARTLLGSLEPRPEHGWLAFHEGYIAQLRGETAAAIERAGDAVELGRRFAVPDLEMLGLALQGSGLVAAARVEEGMELLDEATATALAGEAQVPISSAWTCCFLVTACSAVKDFERAAEWCDRIAEFAERYGSRYMLAFCRSEYGAVHRWRGDWSAAEGMLEASVEDFARSRPAWAQPALVELAELRRCQGRWEEAERLLERAGPSAGAQLSRAAIALDRGEPRSTAAILTRLLRQLPDDRLLGRAPALELLVLAHAADGDPAPAEMALAELRRLERTIGTDPLAASADRAEGMLRAAEGERAAARRLLEDALDRFERCGSPFEAARSRLELATLLIADAEVESGLQEAALARTALAGLGAAAAARRAERLLSGGEASDREQPLPELTAREREVLALLAEGLTNAEIAERLVVSEHTIHRHVTNILRKLDAPTRAAAAAQAALSGLLGEPK